MSLQKRLCDKHPIYMYLHIKSLMMSYPDRCPSKFETFEVSDRILDILNRFGCYYFPNDGPCWTLADEQELTSFIETYFGETDLGLGLGILRSPENFIDDDKYDKLEVFLSKTYDVSKQDVLLHYDDNSDTDLYDVKPFSAEFVYNGILPDPSVYNVKVIKQLQGRCVNSYEVDNYDSVGYRFHDFCKLLTIRPRTVSAETS